MKKYSLILGVFLFVFAFSANAQTDTTSTTTSEEMADQTATSTTDVYEDANADALIVQDESVTAADLGIQDPTLLPDSKLYFFKNWGRSLRLLFTFDPAKEAALNMQYADEMLIEAKKLAQKTNNPTALANALANYEKQKTKVEEKINELKSDPTKQAQLQALLERVADKEIKSQKILEVLANNSPEALKNAIEQAQDGNLQTLTSMLTGSLSDADVQKLLTKVAESQNGSQFKNFKNLEILQKIEEKAPERAKEAIQKAQENALIRLHGNLENMSLEDQAKFADYISKIDGNSARHLEIVEQLSEEDQTGTLEDLIKRSKEKAFDKLQESLSEKKTEQQKEAYLKHLEGGTLEDAKIINLIANNLGDGMGTASSTRELVFSKLRDRINDANRRDDVLKDIPRLADADVLAVLSALSGNATTTPGDLVGQAREMAKEAILRQLNESGTTQQRDRIAKKLASDDPEALLALDKAIEQAQTDEERARLQEIKDQILAKIQSRVDDSNDVNKLERLRERVSENEDIKRALEKNKINLEDRIRDRSATIMERINNLLNDVEVKIAKLEELIVASPGNKNVENAKRALTEAKKKAAEGKNMLDQQKANDGYGQLNAAMRLLDNAIRLLSPRLGDDMQNGTTTKDMMESRTEMQKQQLEQDREALKQQLEQSNITPQQREELKTRLEDATEAQKQQLEQDREALKQQLENKDQEQVLCTQQFEPVCGVDGKTYPNECVAVKQNQVRIAHKGSCEAPAPLPTR